MELSERSLYRIMNVVNYIYLFPMLLFSGLLPLIILGSGASTANPDIPFSGGPGYEREWGVMIWPVLAVFCFWWTFIMQLQSDSRKVPLSFWCSGLAFYSIVLLISWSLDLFSGKTILAAVLIYFPLIPITICFNGLWKFFEK